MAKLLRNFMQAYHIIIMIILSNSVKFLEVLKAKAFLVEKLSNKLDILYFNCMVELIKFELCDEIYAYKCKILNFFHYFNFFGHFF